MKPKQKRGNPQFPEVPHLRREQRKKRFRNWWKGYLAILVTVGLIAVGAIFQNGLAIYPIQMAQQYPLLWVAYAAVLLGPGIVLRLLLWRTSAPPKESPRTLYLRAVRDYYKNTPLVIDLGNARKSGEEPIFPEVVQTLRYQNDPHRMKDTAEATKSTQTSRSFRNVDQILDEFPHASRSLVILGDPGGGKTTFLRQSTVERAKAVEPHTSAYLPVFISLPKFAPLLITANSQTNADHDEDTEEEAPDVIRRYLEIEEEEDKNFKGIASYAAALQEAVHRGNTYLFLDGWDEVAVTLRGPVRRWINNRQKQLNAYNVICISTRFTSYTSTDFPDSSEWVTEKMDAGTRQELAEKLLPVLEIQWKNDHPDELPRNVDLSAGKFVGLIAMNQQRDLIGGNPLLFSLAARAFVDDGTGAFPRWRVLLYRKFIITLLDKVMKRRQQNEPDLKDAEPYGILDGTFRVLANVALWLFMNRLQYEAMTKTPGRSGSGQEEEGESFTAANIAAAVQYTKADYPTALQQANEPTMEIWVITSGVLEPFQGKEGITRYRFRHPTVLEYLVSVALARQLLDPDGPLNQKAWKTIEDNWPDPKWTEPMRMLAGALMAEPGNEVGSLQQLVEWFKRLQQQAEKKSDPSWSAALELAVASLAEIPAIEAIGHLIDVSWFLDHWLMELLELATMVQQPQEHPDAIHNTVHDLFNRFQRLSEKVALLPEQLSQTIVQQLQATLRDDTHPERQLSLAKAMEGMGELIGRQIEPLTRILLEGRNDQLRIVVAHTLAVLERYDYARGQQSFEGHTVLEQGLQGTDTALAHIIAQGLNGAGERAWELIELALDAARDDETRQLGTTALGNLGKNAIPRLEELSHDTVAGVATTAIVKLKELGAPTEQLEQRLRDLAQKGVVVEEGLQAFLPSSLRRLGYQVNVISGSEVIIPPMVTIPAGAFLMGSDKKKDSQAQENELPQHTVTLGAYEIGKYPLTVAEYACFVRATRHAEPPDEYGVSWAKQQERSDHPVVNVSWNDMMAYVQWLVQMTDQPFRLPTEAEWEKAARGTDGRIYPWGNGWDKTRANTDDGGPRSTTPVGSYPQGASPYECLDMAGNVWEWTSTLYTKYPYRNDINHENNNSTNNRVLRGGSWINFVPENARAAYRYYDTPDDFDGNRGGRVARARLSAGS